MTKAKLGLYSVYFSICAVLTIAMVRCAWLVPYLPTNDGPMHLYGAYLKNRCTDLNLLGFAKLGFIPLNPYQGFMIIMAPLEKWLGWQVGIKVALSIILVLNAWGFCALVIAFKPKRIWISFLGFPLAWSWNLYMGFFAFAIGTGIGYWILAYVLIVKNWRWKKWLILSILFYVQASAHIFTAVLTGFTVATFILAAEPTWHKRYQKLKTLVWTGMPALIIVMGTLISLERHPDLGTFNIVTNGVHELLNILPKIVAPGPTWYANLWMLAILLSIIYSVTKFRKGQLSFPEKIFLGIALLFWFLAIFIPRDISSWQFFSQRFVTLGAVFSLLLIRLEDLGSSKRAMTLNGIAFALISCGSLWVIGSTNKALAEGCPSITALLDMPANLELNRSNHFVPLEANCGESGLKSSTLVPYLNRDLQAGALAAVATGSWSTFAFSVYAPWMNCALKAKEDALPPAPYDAFGLKLLNSPDVQGLMLQGKKPPHSAVLRMAGSGVAYQYDGIFVTGLNDTYIEWLKELGFIEDWANGSTGFWHFKPCSVQLKLAPGAPPPEKVDLGWQGYDNNIIIGAHLDRISANQYSIPYALCGRTWLKTYPEIKGELTIIDPFGRKNLNNNVKLIE
ncbi:MAG: hypothetical protein V4534_02945 [Myxococcota bacterium]